MQLIAVDIGNSSIRVAVEPMQVGGCCPHATDRWTNLSIFRNDEPIELALEQSPAIWSICSVNRQRQQMLQDWIAEFRPDDRIYLIDDSDVELESNVESRSQVGRDRLVAAWMALQLNDGLGPVIVIDAGTAVTIDLVDAQNVFQGGVIFPGAAATLDRLSDSTDVLPNLSERKFLSLLEDFSPIVGKSTHSAIVRGVHHCQIGGMIHIVNEYQRALGEVAAVYATGGGIFDLQRGLPGDWNFVQDLVLRGAELIGRKLATHTK